MKGKFKTLIVLSRNRLFVVMALVMVILIGLALVISRTLSPPDFPPLPNFAANDQTDDMKAAFIDYITPILAYQNTLILADRSRLERIAEAIKRGGFISWFGREWLEQLAQEYRVEWKEDALGATASELMSRVDILPVPLAIVQAAKESGWGQSRFAVEGNNLFGQWCYDEDCGLEPEQRADGATHQARKFKSTSNAVRSYLRNLNTHESYMDLRRIRQQLRQKQQPITGMSLADGLLLYSEQREAYVEDVKTMIQQYHAFMNARAE